MELTYTTVALATLAGSFAITAYFCSTMKTICCKCGNLFRPSAASTIKDALMGVERYPICEYCAHLEDICRKHRDHTKHFTPGAAEVNQPTKGVEKATGKTSAATISRK